MENVTQLDVLYFKYIVKSTEGCEKPLENIYKGNHSKLVTMNF